ncbi:hypothetical protein HY416_01220 [Candidatus Kaiserbacteria bacterium]|nr:hypothetical protein [Candidatus Kaiserbacteria bacterium]
MERKPNRRRFVPTVTDKESGGGFYPERAEEVVDTFFRDEKEQIEKERALLEVIRDIKSRIVELEGELKVRTERAREARFSPSSSREGEEVAGEAMVKTEGWLNFYTRALLTIEGDLSRLRMALEIDQGILANAVEEQNRNPNTSN